MGRSGAMRRFMLAPVLACMLWSLQEARATGESGALQSLELFATSPADLRENANVERWGEYSRPRPASLQGLEPSVADRIEHTARQRYHAFNVSAKQSFDAFLQQEVAASATCSEMKDCLSCYNLSSWCHYCDDGECHSQASPYGCVTGTTCYKNVDCVRSDVEYVGVKPPSAAVVTGVLVLLLSTFACFACSITLCNAFARSHEKTISEPDPSYLELNTFRTSYRAPFLQASDGYATVSMTDDLDVETPIVPQVSRLQKNKHAVRAATICYIFCGLIAIALVVLSGFAIAYAPAYPEMNVCNQELDWGSIVQGMSSLKLKADYEILTSVYNPNRASIVVHTAEGVFSHSGTVVGRFEITEPVTLPGGSVTDILVTTSFTPSVWKSMELNIAYYQGDLILEADARSTASVLLTGLGGESVYDFVYELKDYFIHVGGKSDRSWCNCPSWE